MPTGWKQVTLFISSTFNDMHAERDYLVKQVFPRLRDWCERRKLRLVDVDLRWGVTEADAAHNRKVVQTCLHRIDDCRPFFLCFLGQRRGWVPREQDISPETLAAFPELKPFIGAASVTELEIFHAVLRPFHPSAGSSNEMSAERFEPARYAYFYLRDPSYLEQLPAKPVLLRQSCTNEWEPNTAARAVHDEVLRKCRETDIPSSGRPVRNYRAEWDARGSTPELRLPLQCPYRSAEGMARWRKQWADAGV